MKKWLTMIAVLVAILGALLLLAGWLVNKRANVLIEAAPSDTTLVLDGKRVRAGKLYTPPGAHRLHASRSGFADKDIAFDSASSGFQTVTVVLSPNSAEGNAYLAKHPQEQLKREALGGKQLEKQGSEQAQKNPIITILPYTDREFSIDYGKSQKNPSDANAIGVYIKYSSESGKQQALDWLKFKGYDPNKLEIIYRQITGF